MIRIKKAYRYFTAPYYHEGDLPYASLLRFLSTYEDTLFNEDSVCPSNSNRNAFHNGAIRL